MTTFKKEYNLLLKYWKIVWYIQTLFPPLKAAEIVECVRKYVDGILQNLQSLSHY